MELCTAHRLYILKARYGHKFRAILIAQRGLLKSRMEAQEPVITEEFIDKNKVKNE